MYDNFIAEGEKVCIEFIKQRKYPIQHILTTTPDIIKSIPDELQSKCELISAKEMALSSALKTPTNLLLVLSNKEELSRTWTKETSTKTVYIDDVQDPGNVGTIIRIADWFGIDTVVRTVGSADFYNPKTVQATMGSMTNVQLYTDVLETSKDWGLSIIGTDMLGSSLDKIKLPQKGIIVLGSEGKGMSPNSKQLITTTITIPGAKSRIADSLNVSMAAGIICSKWI